MQKDANHYTLTKARSGVWYYYAYKPDGTRLKRSTGKRTKKAAEAVIRERIAQGTLLAVTDTLNLRHMTFAEFSEPFWRWDTCPVVRDRIARGGHYSLDFCDINRNNLERHILPYFGKTPLTEIRRKDVDEWLLSLPERDGISASTANKVLTVLRQMLEVAVREGYIEKSPADGIRPLIAVEKARGAFTCEDIEKLFSVRWDSLLSYTACFLSAFTGMRLGEIKGLRVSRVHEDYILIDSSWADKAGLKGTKSGKARVVPITERMRSLVMETASGRTGDGFVFSVNGTTPCEDRAITYAMNNAMEKAEIDAKGRNLTFHSFRHFFNTQMVSAGIPGEIVRKTVGHESGEMTGRYFHVDEAALGQVRGVQLTLTRGVSRRRQG